MANAFTAVPAEPPPAPRGLAKRLLPAADAFMVALASRPPTGTLATTWVTPATRLLAVASLAAALALIAVALTGITHWAAAIVAVVLIACAAFGVGAASVLTVGAAQHRALDGP